MRFVSFGVVVALMLSLSSIDATAQDYPMPGSVNDPPVYCTSCTDPDAALPTWPYSSPIVRFVGRFVDSTVTRDFQSPIRTYRARGFRAAPEHDRAFVMMGSAFYIYRLSTWLESELGLPMSRLPVSRDGKPSEQYLATRLTEVDPDRSPSWSKPISDSQDRLFDFAWDDRGYRYLAYSTYGWGIVNDGGALIKQTFSSNGQNAILYFRSGTKHYVLVSGGVKSNLYDVTVPSTPILVGERWGFRFHSEQQGASDALIAMGPANGTSMRIYRGSDIVANRSAVQTFTAVSPVAYAGIASDGIRFFLAKKPSAVTVDIVALEPQQGLYVERSLGLLPYRYASVFEYNAGYFGFGQTIATYNEPRLLKMQDGVLAPIAVNDFFRNYYINAPEGYRTPNNYTTQVNGFAVVPYNGKTYLIWSNHGMGDVFEIGHEPNVAPQLEDFADRTVIAGRPLNFRLVATDQDNDALEYFAAGAPTTSTLDRNTGDFAWSAATSGTSALRIGATDGNGGVDLTEGSITVLPATSGLTVSSINPISGPAAGATTEINGGPFYSSAVAYFGGRQATTSTVISTAKITATTSALTPGTINDVIVRNGPNGSYGWLNAAYFADFLDVPQSHPFHDAVESIFRAGVTGGCGGGNYCPNSTITRAQMAVYLLRARYGASFVPPPASGTIFVDVPANAFAASYIERLVQEQVTGGCGGGRYCGSSSITAAQLAVFLLRMKEGPTYFPPTASGTMFDDVPLNSPFLRWVEELVRRGVSSGCGPRLFCPNVAVTRDQMADLVKKTFAIP